MKAAFKRLCESAFDFLARSVEEIERSPKHALVAFAAGMELLLKARLVREHWSLIVAGKPDAKRFNTGDFTSVSLKEALEKLRNALEEPVPGAAEAIFARIAQHRNAVVHHYHELDEDEFRNQVALDMCLGWFHLHTWLRRAHFFDLEISIINSKFQKVKTYLTAAFLEVKPRLDQLENDGVQICECPLCGFQSAPLKAMTDIIFEQDCLVCNLRFGRVQFTCFECGVRHEFDGWNNFNPVQCECGETLTRDLVRISIDDAASEDRAINCGECESAGTVARSADHFVCLECAHFGHELQTCEWCSEAQLGGGSLEMSYVRGCCACDGAGFPDD